MYDELAFLLDMNGETFVLEKGYWTKFEVHRVELCPEIPHGIRYSLTLHDRTNKRVFGIDNAHALKVKRKKYGAKKITWDHKHNKEHVTNYEFDSAGKLLEDFWDEVHKIIELTFR